MDPAKDFELKRTASGRSIPAIPQTPLLSGDAEGVMSSSPKSLVVGDAAKEISSEDLPTPPQTPGQSSANDAAAETNEPPSEETVPEAELPSVKKVSYHEDADLDVSVQEADGVDAIYSVRASALQNASLAWKQSMTSETPAFDLTSDPAPGLDVIFSIAHYKFEDVPQEVDGNQIHDIVFVAEKYQTLHLLLPFLKGWLASLAGPSENAEKALVTGWILGQAEWFSQAVSQVANSASVSTDGTLLDAEGRPWHEKRVSSEVIELIAATRASTIERIIKAVTTPMTKLLNPEVYPEETIRYCHAPEEDAAIREECEQLQLGSAIMGLTKARLWPAPEASRIRASPVELASAYKDVRMRRYQTPGLRFQEEEVKDAHADCGFGHHGEIESILSEPATLTDAVVRDLQTRAERCGAVSKAPTTEVSAPVEEVVAEDANKDNCKLTLLHNVGLHWYIG
ncbi:unnamed protein product [Discula destructiva]